MKLIKLDKIADNNQIDDSFTVTEIKEGEKYLIELNYDWDDTILDNKNNIVIVSKTSPFKKSNWCLNSESLPVEGTRIEITILEEIEDIDNDDILEDLDKTKYSITLFY